MHDRREQAFTLTELMVVVVIVGLLALIAVPTLSRDSGKSNYESFANEVYQTLQRARMEAISAREDRRVRFDANKTTYYFESFLNNTPAMLKRVLVRNGLEIVGQRGTSGGTTSALQAPPFEVYFSAVSDVSLKSGACGGSTCTDRCACSVILFLQSTDGVYQGRIEISQSTGYIRLFDRW